MANLQINAIDTITVSENFISLLNPLVINSIEDITIIELIMRVPRFITIGTRIFRNSQVINRRFVDTDT